MWTQARLAREAGVSPTTVSAIETGKIGRPHFGTIGKLARALRVAPEELLDSQEAVEQQGPVPLSLGWARDTGEGEFESGLENASLESLDSLSRGLDVEQERLQRLYGEFPEGSEQGRFIKRQIREVAGRSGSVKASAMVRRNQDDAKRKDEHSKDTESSSRKKSSDQHKKPLTLEAGDPLKPANHKRLYDLSEKPRIERRKGFFRRLLRDEEQLSNQDQGA
jgi:transcriptional regulator with XRE-family HTH domain